MNCRRLANMFFHLLTTKIQRKMKTFSYYCDFDKKTINETVETVEFDSEINRWIFICKSCAVYSANDLVELGALESVPLTPAAAKEEQRKRVEAVLIEQIKALGLYADYETAFPISVAPLSAQGLGGFKRQKPIRAAYERLQAAGFSFKCGVLVWEDPTK